MLFELLDGFGPIFEREETRKNQLGMISIFIEYCDTRDAMKAMATMNGLAVKVYRIVRFRKLLINMKDYTVFVEVNEPDVSNGEYIARPISVRPKSYVEISSFGFRHADRLASSSVSFPLSRSFSDIESPPFPSSGAILSPTGRSLLYPANPSTFPGAR